MPIMRSEVPGRWQMNCSWARAAGPIEGGPAHATHVHNVEIAIAANNAHGLSGACMSN
jgi:hypothetical protein